METKDLEKEQEEQLKLKVGARYIHNKTSNEYIIISITKMKHPDTGEWIPAVIYKVDGLREHMHLPDSMVGNSRLKLNNVRTTMTNILAKVSIPPYNCDGKDRCCQLIINSADRIIYHTGLAFNIGNDANGEPNEMSLRPRSNLTKSDFYMPNAPGTLGVS